MEIKKKYVERIFGRISGANREKIDEKIFATMYVKITTDSSIGLLEKPSRKFWRNFYESLEEFLDPTQKNLAETVRTALLKKIDGL